MSDDKPSWEEARLHVFSKLEDHDNQISGHDKAIKSTEMGIMKMFTIASIVATIGGGIGTLAVHILMKKFV